MAKNKNKVLSPNKNDSVKACSTIYSKMKFFLYSITVIILWSGHYAYLFTLFENDRFFSHLSDMEREMSYRTEMGLYFSYYKTLVEAPTFTNGLYSITHDNITEAGHTINTLQRFNLYPEVYLSLFFRTFKGISDHFKVEWQSCFHVRRGSDLPPVMSCEGIGNLHYFYVHSVFILAGIVLPAIFLLGLQLSGSYFGGLASAIAFMANHGHSTRVMWTPPLRESFGYPIFCLQLCLLTWILRKPAVNKVAYIILTSLTTHFILFWQFSGFVLFTQISCIFCTYVLGYLDSSKLRHLFVNYVVAFSLSFGLLFGNLMLLSSLFFTSLVSILILITCRPLLTKISNNYASVIINLMFYLLFTFVVKFCMNNLLKIHDDSHVFDILRSKFTNHYTFHTSLYTCAAEFDFVDLETLKSISQTGLLPLALLSFLIASIGVLRSFGKVKPIETVVDNNLLAVVYNTGQLFCFVLIAGLIMRLKLFAVPHLCVFLPVIFNQDIQLIVFKRKIPWSTAIIFLYIGLLAFQGQKNVVKQLSINGEFNNESQERLFRWIDANTDKDSIFAGSMSLMANVKLSTLRPIFNHPHYEDEGIRERTIKAYSMYSRKDPKEVHKLLKSLGINYFIYEPQHCAESSRPQCTYLGMFDKIDIENRNRPSICSQFIEPIEQANNYEKLLPFKVVYNTFNYAVLKI